MTSDTHLPHERIRLAMEVFVAGFAETKCRTWPYEIRRLEGIWQMRDAPRKNPDDYRKEEWITCNAPAARIHAQAQRKTRGRYFIGSLVATADSIAECKARYTALNYRLLATEPFFTHNLKRIPRSPRAAQIELLRTEQLSLEFATASRTRPEIPTTYLNDSFRQYLAYVDQVLVGWVRSIETAHGNWCSNLYVKPDYRRRGIALTLLGQMLRDDRNRGALQNVLLSTHSGALLYPKVGYQQLGTLLIFAPKKT